MIGFYHFDGAIACSVFLFDAPRQVSLVLATQLNTFVLAYLLWKQGKLTRELTDSPDSAQANA